MRYVLFLVLVLSACVSKNYTDIYFRPIPASEQKEALKSFGVTSCDELKARYFSSDDASSLLAKGIAHDKGFCVKQNLENAVAYYEQAFKTDQTHVNFYKARAGVLYAYGPDSIRDLSKSRFYFKQAVIHFAMLEDISVIKKGLHNVVDKTAPFPDGLNQEIQWLRTVKALPKKKRMAIAESLEQQGFSETENILYDIKSP